MSTTTKNTSNRTPHKPQLSSEAVQQPTVETPPAATPQPKAKKTRTPVASPGAGNAFETSNVQRPWAVMNAVGSTLGADARVKGFWTPMKDKRDQVFFTWDKTRDTIPFKMSAHVKGNPSLDSVKPLLHTNANNAATPDKWDDLVMDSSVHVKGHVHMADGSRKWVDQKASGAEEVRKLLSQLGEGEYDIEYTKDLKITQLGTYEATALTRTASKVESWAGTSGIKDVVFRPHAATLNQVSLYEVSVPNVNSNGWGTLEDMTEPGSPFTNGKCTLEYIAKELGFNGVWMMPVFKRTEHGRHPVDDLGSPYGIRDMFTIDPLLSRKARELQKAGAPAAEVEKAAQEAWDNFAAKCKELGVEICMDLPFNHFGHNYEFKDVIRKYDEAGNLVSAEVRANDFSQVAINSEQLDVIKRRLADPNVPDYLEHVLPEFYGSTDGNPWGASHVSKTQMGGSPWEPWKDVKNKNNGGEHNPGWNAQKKKVVEYDGRATWWQVFHNNVSMLRLDHDNANREDDLEFTNLVINPAQAQLGPDKPLGLVYENFHTAGNYADKRDYLQVTWLRSELAKSNSADSYRNLLNNQYFTHANLANITSHDELRFDFHGNPHVAGRTYALNGLLFNMFSMVAGDEMMEQKRFPFKQHQGVPSLAHQSNPALNRITCEYVRKMNRAKHSFAAFQNPDVVVLNKAWNKPQDKDLIAAVRHPFDTSEPSVFIFGNTTENGVRGGRFDLDGESRKRIEAVLKKNPNAKFQVFNQFADDPTKPVWKDGPRTGQDLLQNGIGCDVTANEVQVLVLREVQN